MYWDARDHIPDLTGRTVVITGCTSGIGLETARQLLNLNATIVMACRNVDKMRQVAESISSGRNTQIHQLQLDVSDLDSVKAFPDALNSAGVTTVDIIVLNAGIVETSWSSSPQGLELVFATNVLGHWLLVGLLVPFLSGSAAPRIVAVSSLTHFLTPSIDYDGVKQAPSTGGYRPGTAYAQSKLAQHWLVAQINQRLQDKLPALIAVAAHPGYAFSAISDPSSNRSFSFRLFHIIFYRLQQTTAQGAWPLVLAAGGPDVLPDQYYGPSGLLELWGPPCSNARRAAATDDVEKQNELWQFCERMTQFTYPE